MANKRTNKLFERDATLWHQFGYNYDKRAESQVTLNRAYLITPEVAADLNTYKSFTPFPTYNDLFAPEYEKDKDGKYVEVNYEEKKKKVGSGTPGVRSLFNRTSAVILGVSKNQAGSIRQEDLLTQEATTYRIMNNVPLMDNAATRKAIKFNSKCSVKDLVEYSQKGLMGKNIYSYADFMFCKYLGRISNNYLITLRRFPYPVDDFISSLGVGNMRRGGKHGEMQSQNADSIGCMVTWIGTPGNDMANILKYSVAMPFREQKSQWQQGGVDADSGGGLANSLAAAFDPEYRKQFAQGHAGTQLNALFGSFAGFKGDPPYPASHWNSHVDQTKVYGPVDAIKTTYTRSEDGLDFQQTIQLVFDYELRSYNGINPRQAMLDLIANILNVTYNTGTFWGGGYRGGGAHQNNIFTNLPIFTQGDKGKGLVGFIETFSESFNVVAGKAKSAIEANGGLLETLKKLANNIGGMLISGFLNKLGRPQKAMANSLLSPAPVGLWHLTIGNPHHPIMSIGNLILKNTTIQHYGPLGIDDFPIGLKVTCELIRGKSRDIRDIEKLYMKGNDRIYSPMDKKVFDMYTHSREYQSKSSKLAEVGVLSSYKTQDGEAVIMTTGDNDSPTQLTSMQSVLLKYFGNTNTKSILISAMEQEHGAAVKKTSQTAGNDTKSKTSKKTTSKPKTETAAPKNERPTVAPYYNLAAWTHADVKRYFKNINDYRNGQGNKLYTTEASMYAQLPDAYLNQAWAGMQDSYINSYEFVDDYAAQLRKQWKIYQKDQTSASNYAKYAGSTRGMISLR